MPPKAMEAADRGASQPAASFTTAAASQRGVWGGTGRAHCASQPVARTSVSQSEHVSDDASFVCVKLNIASFNFGMHQTMMASPKAWTKHAPTLCRLLEQFGLVCDGDLIFACELGGHRPGATATKVDFGNVVKEALPLSQSTTSGAYAIAQLKDTSVFVPPSGRDGQMQWTIFSGASQPTLQYSSAFQRAGS